MLEIPSPPMLYYHCTMAISVNSLRLQFVVSPAVLKFESRPVFLESSG